MGEKEERKLTKAELIRKEEFDKLTARLIEEGYKPNHITMSTLAGNIYAILAAMPVAVPLLLLFWGIWNEVSLNLAEFWIAYLLFFILVVGHELIHGITWSIFAKNGWKSISFGFILKYLTPYCHCSEPMKKKHIIIGALMPTILLGIVPSIIAICTGSALLMLVAIFMIYGGGADLLITYKMLRYKSKGKEVLFIDHPYELGTAVFER